MSFTVHGIGVSAGIAIGYAHLISHTSLEVVHYHVPKDAVPHEVERFDSAVQSVRAELQTLLDNVPPSAPAEFADLVRRFECERDLVRDVQRTVKLDRAFLLDQVPRFLRRVLVDIHQEDFRALPGQQRGSGLAVPPAWPDRASPGHDCHFARHVQHARPSLCRWNMSGYNG
mgnify:CR=1 FL=1